MINNVTDLLAWGSSGVAAALFPILVKAIRSKDFRQFVAQGIKSLFMALLNRVEITHRLFYNSERYKAMAQRVSFPNDKVKTKLFQIMLNTKIDTTVELIKKFINDKENHKLLSSRMHKMELRNKLEALTMDIVETYEKRTPENYFKYLEDRNRANYFFSVSYKGMCKADCPAFLEKGEPCGKDCDATIGFEEYHRRNIEPINDFMETIPECEGEKNNVLLSFYLNHIDNALYKAVHDAKKVFEKQNGRYKFKI